MKFQCDLSKVTGVQLHFLWCKEYICSRIYLLKWSNLSTRKLNLEDMHHIYYESLIKIVVYELGDTRYHQ